jgi:hypothetical protein
MNKILNAFFLLALSFTIVGCDYFKPNDIALTEEFVSTDSWGESDGYGWNLIFKKNGRYTIDYIGEGCGGHDGSYKIDRNLILLEADNDAFCFPNEIKSTNCEMKSNSNSLDYQYYLDCKEFDLILFGLTRKTLPNLERKYADRKVITMGLKNGTITESAKYRSEPDKSSTPIECMIDVYTFDESKTIQAFPKDFELTVIARTENKEKVDKWENYWYLVKPNLGYGDYCLLNNVAIEMGWVFGEFIKIDN